MGPGSDRRRPNFNPNAFILDASAFGNSLGGGTFNLAVAGNALVLNFRPYHRRHR